MTHLYGYLGFVKNALTITALTSLTLLLWPGALTAIASLPFFGTTIAALVGANQLFQIGLIAAILLAATHVVGLAAVGLQALGNLALKLGGLIKNCCIRSSADVVIPDHLDEPICTSYEKITKELPQCADVLPIAGFDTPLILSANEEVPTCPLPVTGFFPNSAPPTPGCIEAQHYLYGNACA